VSTLFSSESGPSPAQPDTRGLPRIGDYELLEEIARGGMGIIFKARQKSVNRIVAVKMITAGHLASPALKERFRTETEAAANLDHPNIVPIYEVGDQDGQNYFSMRFVEGGTLTDAVGRQPFEPCRAAALMVAVSRAVHYAHQRGILHRDLKPGNILLDAKGEPHVTDFGLARLLESDSDLTRTEATLGTPSYIAPEQAGGHVRQLTTAADVYSLGAILYELLAGRPSFKAGSVVETLRQVVEKTPERPRVLNPRLDRDLETICLKCLEKEPKHRYGSAEALAADLDRWLAGETIVARPSSATERVVKWARREPLKAMLTAVSCIAIVALIGIAQGHLEFQAEQSQRKKTEAALDEANRQTLEAEKQWRLAGELERQRSEDAEARLELQRVDAWLVAEEEDYALAYLASLAERFPSNSLVAERVLGELSVRELPTLLFGPTNRFLALSQDGQTLVLGSGQKELGVRFINLRSSGAAPPPLGVNGVRISYLSQRNSLIAFDAGADFVVTVDTARKAQIWKARTGEPVGGSFALSTLPTAGRLLQRGRRLLVHNESECSLWETSTGRMLESWRVDRRGNRWNVNVNGDERHLALSENNNQSAPFIKLINLESGAVLNTYPATGYTMEFSPKGDLLALATGGKLALLEIHSLRTRTNLSIESGISLMRFTPSGDGLLLAFLDNRVQVLSLADMKSRFSTQVPANPGGLSDIQFSADGLRFVTAGRDNRVRLFRTENGGQITQPLDHRKPVIRAWFSHDGERLFTMTENSLFRIWDLTTLPSPRQIRSPKVKVQMIAQPWNSGDVGVPIGVEPESSIRSENLWGTASIPPVIPGWIPGFLEMWSGLKLDARGRGVFVSQAEIPALRERLAGLSNPDLFERFARWAITPSTIRPKAPYTSPGRTVSELIAENSPESLREALWLAPSNGLALSRHAWTLLNAQRWNSGE